MDTCIKIQSRLTHFRLMTRITHVSATGIQAVADLDKAPAFTGLEAMAQLAALHTRYRLEFKRHAFLLKVDRARWPAEAFLEGRLDLTAELSHGSSHAYGYQVRAQVGDNGRLQADLLIGTTDYDDRFREDKLASFYREIFMQGT